MSPLLFIEIGFYIIKSYSKEAWKSNDKEIWESTYIISVLKFYKFIYQNILKQNVKLKGRQKVKKSGSNISFRLLKLD